MLETPKAPTTDKVRLDGMITMDNQQETLIAWFAGILDGEGYVSICKNQYKHPSRGNPRPQYVPRITIGSTSMEIIEKCARACEAVGVGYLIKNRKLNSTKNFRSLMVVGMKRALVLIPRILPYLTLKAANAKRILQFIEMRFAGPINTTYTQEQLELIDQCKTGPSEATREAPTTEEVEATLMLLDDDMVHATDENCG